MKTHITILFFLLFTYHSILHAQQKVNPIHVEVIGEGNPILFLPGFTVPGEIYQPMVQQLEENYECHIISLAGFGGYEPIEFPWLDKVNDAIYNYIKLQELENAIVIGHSLGGTIATWLASKDGIELSQIILIDALPAAGALMIPNFNPEYLAYDSPFNNQILEMSDSDFEQMASNMSKGMSLNPKAQNQIKDWIIQCDRKTYVYGYTDYLKMDLREDLKKITVPVTIFAATEPYGKETITKNYKNQYDNLKDYNLIIAEQSAHFIMLDKPEWFINKIREILSYQK